jgi:hypothetical protein
MVVLIDVSCTVGPVGLLFHRRARAVVFGDGILRKAPGGVKSFRPMPGIAVGHGPTGFLLIPP